MLDKAIYYGKEHRKSYHGAKAIDCTCRNHGSCEYCRLNREFTSRKWKERMDSLEKEFRENY